MTQIRWAVIKFTLGDGDAEQAELVDGSVEEYIREEVEWLNDSFADVEVIEISNEYDENIGEEEK